MPLWQKCIVGDRATETGSSDGRAVQGHFERWCSTKPYGEGLFNAVMLHPRRPADSREFCATIATLPTANYFINARRFATADLLTMADVCDAAYCAGLSVPAQPQFRRRGIQRRILPRRACYLARCGQLRPRQRLPLLVPFSPAPLLPPDARCF